MKLSELIREYVDLKIQGEPDGSEWISIAQRGEQRRAYHNRLEEIEEQIDDAAAGEPPL